ncbi:MAG TPA: pyrroline-5-carboxylate reductase [Bacillota bacterium]
MTRTVDMPAFGPEARAGRVEDGGAAMDGVTVTLVGAGKMAEALIAGWLRTATLTPRQIRAGNRRDRRRLRRLAGRYGVVTATRKARLLDGADVVVLAVKPADAAAAMAEAAPYLTRRQVVVSVMAGVRLARLAEGLGGHRNLVRAMPNTSCSLAAGATALCPGPDCDPHAVDLARRLFDPLGVTVDVSEDLFDAVTAVSGSGPAYVYLLAEAVIDAARALGLSDQAARLLTAQTILGAGRMLLGEGADPAELRRRVTSPGGTTAAALAVLEEAGTAAQLHQAVQQAAARSAELAHS